ncbi:MULTISPECIES: hypothetical protein [Bacillus]|uniref:Uncharacterized protein n=2 Tax=Bacillus cereus group TaxID=86661 RepID=A0A9X8XB02_9BACI|nr:MULTISPECIES: hypothetical protein [Bacillus]EEK94310.1 hypothetical protein bcere0012_27690 [Bacillus cereus BDRD-ST24]SDI15238.1 hypothetical protein SAMN04488578_104409 [Bacillus sp. cl96]ALZ61242.1 hypothetical protein FORC13_2181 [Bacillus cereus]ASK15141.1 hypothetical protein BA201_14900 [Bacillus cereus]EKS7861523.1 hypothetical protein [Bacillus cereus]
MVRNWLQEKETDESMSVLRISNKKSQCRFCEKTWIECNERNILEYGKAEGPTPEQLYKKYGSWENVIYGSLKTNPAMDVIVWEENNYERRKNTR